MYSLSTAVVAALGLSRLASGQSAPIQLPEVTGDSGSGGNCGGCYVVADVAGVAFGTETLQAVQTNNVIMQNNFTTTQVVFNQGQFTVAPSGLAGGAAPAATGGANTAFNTDGSTLVISGVTLTSPTAYNVFTAYSTTRTVFTNGACSVIAGSAVQLSSAFSVVVPPGVDFRSFQVEAESSFINNIGLPSCSAGGENYAATTHVPVNVSTTTVTTSAAAMTRNPSPVSVAATTAATTVGPTASVSSTFLAFSPIANASRATFLPNGTGTIVLTNNLPTSAIAVGQAPRLSTVGSWFAGAIALIAGLAA